MLKNRGKLGAAIGDPLNLTSQKRMMVPCGPIKLHKPAH
jgi:hypothetical protein